MTSNLHDVVFASLGRSNSVQGRGLLAMALLILTFLTLHVAEVPFVLDGTDRNAITKSVNLDDRSNDIVAFGVDACQSASQCHPGALLPLILENDRVRIDLLFSSTDQTAAGVYRLPPPPPPKTA